MKRNAARAGELSNKDFASLMPSWIESIMVVRVSELAKLEGAMKSPIETYVKAPTLWLGSEHSKPADGEQWLRSTIAQCGVESFAWGGSKFTPKDYEFINIYETTRPVGYIVAGLREGKPPLGSSVSVDKVDGVEVFLCKRVRDRSFMDAPEVKIEPVGFFVAALSEHVIVWAARRDAIEIVIKAFPRRGGKTPRQWAPLADGAGWSGPFVIVRKFDKANCEDFYSPTNPRIAAEDRLDVDSVLIAVRDATTSEFEVKAITKEPKAARRWIFQRGLTYPEFRWIGEDAARGFSGKFVYQVREGEGNRGVFIGMLVLFGINVVI